MRPPGYYARGTAYLLNRWLLGRRHLVARARLLGMRFRFRTPDVVGRHIYKFGLHEPELTDWLVQNLRPVPGDVLLDVGANLGWFTVLFDRLSPDGVAIHAFEPDPVNFDLLSHNLRLNGTHSVTAHRVAVAEEAGTATLHLYDDRNRGKHSLLPIVDRGGVTVSTVDLDGFLETEGIDPGRIRLVKMDVEGFEYQVLRGMPRLLEQVPVVLCELLPKYLAKVGRDPRDLLDLLFSAGLHPFYLGAEGPIPADRDELAASSGRSDLLWLRQ